MAVDLVPDSGAKKVKTKKSKEQKAAEREQLKAEAQAVIVDAGGDDKKSKKRRAEANGEGEEEGEDSEKKKKKKKRKHAEAEAETATVAVESTESDKKSKKRKQEKKQTQNRRPLFPRLKNTRIRRRKTRKTLLLPLPPILKFDQLAIPSELRSCFKGFSAPTPIQACTWPPALLGRDVVGIAETGSGKTLAFGIPALARLITSPRPNDGSSTISVLVVAPTRELALQTHDTLSALGGPLGIASVAVFGGVPKEPQVRMLRNLNKGKDGLTTRVVVGTPGRILDLVQDGALRFEPADRMLDKGFENDIRNIISNTKQGAERQTMMFSATWPDAVRRLASTFQQDPVRVTVGSDDLTANSRVEQVVEVFDDGRSKDNRLLGHLRALGHKKTTKTGEDEARILVFALYKKEASRVEQRLRQEGYSVGALHGDLSQSARMEALERFKNGTTGLLVATDVAARGLDIPNVGAVINYTFPLTIEDYIHRIGRTGRGGKSGKSITFFTGDAHERSLAGELARVLRESGFQCEGLKKFPMTIKKKEHGVYGAFFRDDITKKATKIVFD
ncbi:P-loop containing nucleoside triphosphate hydrolase protein [Mycena olivaceomarginata]|nr:P-loop containing nucleoside triphosphate hydrolase protein [Mycena olivaceomarginata]